MSKTNNVTEELQEQKVVTSYDRKEIGRAHV